MAQPIAFQAVVERVERHDADVASYTLRAQKRLPRFTPGQFIHLTLEAYDPAGFWPDSRVFSAANAVGDRQTVDLTISRQGDYTSKILDSVESGQTLWCKGPYGDFRIDGQHGYDHAALVAGGTGITPFAAFMDAMLTTRTMPVGKVTLYYGARTPELLLYRSRAEQCADTLSDFTVHCYAETGACRGGVHGGSLDIDAIVANTQDLARTIYYLSGPRAMIDTFQTRLIHEYRLDDEQVMIDAWG